MLVHFSGTVKLSYMGLPMETMLDLSEHGTGHAFVTAWVDRSRSQSAHVKFQDDSMESQPGKGRKARADKAKVMQNGSFQFSMPLCHQDPDRLKLQFCLRMRDQETNNRRSMELCMSYADMKVMLQGKTDTFRIVNQFDQLIAADVSLSITNAEDFRNHPSSASDCSKPYLTLVASKLRLLESVNKDAEDLSVYMQKTLDKNRCVMPPGGAAFQMGLTRSVPIYLCCPCTF